MRGLDQTRLSIEVIGLAAVLAVAACQRGGEGGREGAGARDSSDFAAMQARGEHVMGVDQYTSAHVFEDLPDGGRIVLDDTTADSAAIATIRAHMRDIEAAFGAGDFSKPFEVHEQTVPGTDVMRARRAAISYQAIDRVLGGQVRIKSSDPVAVAAIHQFLAFQREQHRAAGHEM